MAGCFLAAMGDWTPREFDVELSFIGDGKHKAEIYQDGINADKYGSDYKHISVDVDNKSSLKIKLAPGGGYAARIILQ